MARWILIKGNQAEDETVVFKCSECGALTRWKKGMKNVYPGDFCFHCGADMRTHKTACLDES